MNVIEFENVTKTYKDFSIKNLNLQIPQGFITGFIGPNGAGKTTIIRMLMDLVRKDSGRITVHGEDVNQHQVREKIGFVYDDLMLYGDWTLARVKKVVASAYPRWSDTLYEKYLNTFNLSEKKKLKTFSKGMKMKASLLLALSHQPEIIIMDEPTSGLDPVFRREFLHLLQDLMEKENQTIFFSTHITTDLDQIADYLIFIDKGQVLLQTDMESLKENYFILKGKSSALDADVKNMMIGYRENHYNFTGLIAGNKEIFDEFTEDFSIENASIEDIIYFMTKGDQ